MKRMMVVAAALAAMTVAGSAQAADHQIQMLNKGADGTAMVFQPDFVQAEPGDTITFVPTDKGHDASSIKGMIPDGAQPFTGKISQGITVTLDKEGVYGVKCVPHYGMGMVALIVVGKPVNLKEAEAVKQIGKAKPKFAELFAKIPAN